MLADVTDPAGILCFGSGFTQELGLLIPVEEPSSAGVVNVRLLLHPAQDVGQTALQFWKWRRLRWSVERCRKRTSRIISRGS